MTFEDTLENDGITKGINDKNNKEEEDMHDSKNSTPGFITTQQPPTSTLNPFAKEWSPATEGPSLVDRSLFMTFSRGHPLSKWEIVSYFERNYGNCVEDVFIYMPRNGRAEFGKITFKVSSIPRLVLKDKEREKINIGGKNHTLEEVQVSLNCC
nr:uncharacterized protein LOC113728728 [Coffea arabica]